MKVTFSHRPYATDYMRTCLQVIENYFGCDLHGKNALDIPAGNGWLTDRLRERGVQATPADINDERPEFLQINMEEPLPLDGESFDMVICAEGIEHVFNPANLFSELTRVLRPGGLLVITTPNVQSLRSRLQHLCCGYLYQFEPFTKTPLTAGVLGDKGHISPVFYTQLRYYADHFKLRVHRPMGGDIAERALKIVLLFPAIAIGYLWALRDCRKSKNHTTGKDIIQHLFSWPVLHSRSLVFVCSKPQSLNESA